WKKFFNSRLVNKVKRFADIYSYAVILVLLLLFFDAVREVRKYAHVDISMETRHAADADAVVHMRLFRAQRNLYISGFTLLLFLVMKRIVGLLSRSAHLEAAAEAAMKQAESASKHAKTLMDGGDEAVVKKYEDEKTDLEKKLKVALDDKDAMKKQAENLQKEYDRVCDLLNAHETGSTGGKKDD
ncbi:B-cell receptor-associated protein 31-like containing protein, partial [Aphelenchoides avenae]